MSRHCRWHLPFLPTEDSLQILDYPAKLRDVPTPREQKDQGIESLLKGQKRAFEEVKWQDEVVVGPPFLLMDGRARPSLNLEGTILDFCINIHGFSWSWFKYLWATKVQILNKRQ